MKISLKPSEVQTLKEDSGKWSYIIHTKIGDVVGSNLPSQEEAIKHAEKNLVQIVKQMLKRKK